MYYREESVIFENLRGIFKDINCNYITNNKNILEILEREILVKYRIFLNNHYNNIKLLNDNIEQFKLAVMRANTIFDEMRGLNEY